MCRKVLFAAAGIALIYGAPAFAEDMHMFPALPDFAEFDADGDQMVTEEEFVGSMEEHFAGHKVLHHGADDEDDRFSAADTDGDGFLSREEFEQAKPRHVRRLVRFAHPGELFARADVDSDGVLIEQEFDGMIEHMQQMRGRIAHPIE
jgi:Ca2+-binding EF-hand superfamily protein